ncbi:integrase, catalytic region, zinc finger, CCHC-type containing protein [Tanacetum coccineum]
MFLNMDQLQKQLDNNEFQEIGSMASFKVLDTHFQMFIKSNIYLNDEYIVMTRNYFLEYTQLDILEFRNTLIQNMDYVKKSIEKRELHKMKYDSRVNERQLQIQQSKVQEVQSSVTSPGDETSSGIVSDEEMKEGLEHITGKSVETQFNKPSVVRQPNAQQIPKPSVLGKPTPFSNSPEMRSFQTKQSVNKTNVSDGLFKQVTQQNLPQIRKQAVRNTNVIAPGPSRNNPKHMSSLSPKEFVGSNDMVHNYYLEKAKKSAQLQKDKDVNGKPSMIDPARLPNTANGCKPKPRNWQASMSSRVSNKDVHLGEHRKQKPFLKFNDLQCPTCKKCLYSANHDECVLEYLSRLNPRASAQNKDLKSHKKTKRYMPVEKSSASKKPERQIPTGHRLSNKKTTTVPEKTMNPRSCLRWKPTGRIFSNVRLRWIPTGKLLNSCTGKVDSEPAHGSIVDIPHIHACKQTLGLSAGTSFNGQKQQRIDLNADALYNEKQENLRVCERPKEWTKWLSLAEYWYNTNFHNSIKTIPFEVLYGQTPLIHTPYVAKDSFVELMDRTLQAREQVITMLKFHLKAAQDRMITYADKKRSEKEFAVGDLVYLNLPLCDSEGSLVVVPYKILDRKLAKQDNRARVYGLIQRTNGSMENSTWELLTDIEKRFPTLTLTLEVKGL